MIFLASILMPTFPSKKVWRPSRAMLCMPALGLPVGKQASEKQRPKTKTDQKTLSVRISALLRAHGALRVHLH